MEDTFKFEGCIGWMVLGAAFEPPPTFSGLLSDASCACGQLLRAGPAPWLSGASLQAFHFSPFSGSGARVWALTWSSPAGVNTLGLTRHPWLRPSG